MFQSHKGILTTPLGSAFSSNGCRYLCLSARFHFSFSLRLASAVVMSSGGVAHASDFALERKAFDRGLPGVGIVEPSHLSEVASREFGFRLFGLDGFAPCA